MPQLEPVMDFFRTPPKHSLQPGDLVTCTCHGGIAIILELYDIPPDSDAPAMDMARIWWIKSALDVQTRIWLHTIARLSKYKNYMR
jgi:hypothetical protein